MFLVVPLMGAGAVATFLVATRHVEGVAAVAAAMVAASPIFLYQVVQPMSDVPAACLWMAALYSRAGH
jgi:hypothetical protein